ncbi:tRNA lysidine(34) synthetase TilS [Sphingomonas sp. SUN039]|uniref:tRNA lysidine(34) synthetase TilS n=1 Tax=Sphingomonas sp. SUN039 TaxID=2937787 RepID=UPI0021646903|nr:tRNA lysidine(34) synthetase TilS [Sphingomonas sp. SUN039]UVO55347.1 tRNA lysidine(34) synthetase TilS [Sphingomonas sp. SUN039]
MPTPNAPPEALLDRFLSDCRRVAPVARDERIGLGVSGGPDSLALLLLAHATFGASVEAATVDHRLRPESTEEAEFVAAICHDLGIRHTVLTLPGRRRGNLGQWARELRYAQLREWASGQKLAWLMTAHHADDQLETVVMRLNRGSGVGGMSGIRARNGNVVRPLLGWRHNELVGIVRASGLGAIDDPSNRDDRYDRARLRKALATADWLDPLAAVTMAAALDEADEALAWASRRVGNERVVREGDELIFDARDLPPEIERRVVAGCIRLLNAKAKLDGPKVTRLLNTLRGAGKSTLDGVACDARGTGWVFRLAPERATGRTG